METTIAIGKSLKDLAQRNFKHTQMFERSAKAIHEVLNTKVHGSENMSVFPEVGAVEVKEIDALHDEVTMLWSDLQVKGVMTWQEGKLNDQKTYRLVSYE